MGKKSESSNTDVSMNSLEVLNLYKAHEYTLSTLLESRKEKNAGAPCVLFEKERSLSWDETYSLCAGISKHLAEKKLKACTKVAIVARNSDLYVALFFALADQNLIAVPVNPELTESEMHYILKHSDSQLVLHENIFSQKVAQATKNLNCETEELDDTYLTLNAPKLFHRGKADNTCLILYTSGTTGFPKGVMHSQKNAVMAGEAFVERMLLNPQDRLLCILPFFHINALFYSLMGAFASGATLLVTQKFSASQFWNLATELKATQVNIIAAVGNILAQRDRKEFNAKHNLQKIYGAPVSAHIEKVFVEDFKVPVVLEGYGMTEIPGAINNQIKGKWKVGTMGVAAKHPQPELKFTELKIIDDEEKEITDSSAGELVVKTPILMQGYFKDPVQTKASFTADGYFKTGDLVKRDNEGFYVFVTRKKDIIRRRGENISGAEIDRCVSLHPKVAECAAIGVPSPLGEEEIFLAIVPKDNSSLDEKEIFEWCQKNLSSIKCPKYIKKFISLPHTPTARVAKFKLKLEKDILIGAIEF